MLKKLVLTLSFVGLTILLMGGSCGGGGPSAKLGNVSDTSLSLTAEVGASATDSFTFENTGDATLTYTITETLDFLEITSGASGSVQAGDTTTVTLEGTCSAVGSFDGNVTVDSNGGEAIVEVTLVCTEPVSQFNIQLEFVGSDFNQSRRDVFTSAAQTWSRVILNDLGDIQGLTKAEGVCSPDPNVPDEPAFNGDIDDLYIVALLADIDGLGGILAQAGPCLVRTDTTELPIYGVMIFDTADVEDLELSRIFDKVILHEMGHVIGFGTYWGAPLFDAPCPSAGTVGFTGANAKIEFGVLGETGNPPVESNQGSDGTDCGHWDEDFFDNELMTGFLGGVNPGNPLSRLTIASLEDIGYTVNKGRGESYSIPLCSPNCNPLGLKSQSNAKPLNEVLLTPQGSVNADGEVELFTNDR